MAVQKGRKYYPNICPLINRKGTKHTAQKVANTNIQCCPVASCCPVNMMSCCPVGKDASTTEPKKFSGNIEQLRGIIFQCCPRHRSTFV